MSKHNPLRNQPERARQLTELQQRYERLGIVYKARSNEHYGELATYPDVAAEVEKLIAHAGVVKLPVEQPVNKKLNVAPVMANTAMELTSRNERQQMLQDSEQAERKSDAMLKVEEAFEPVVEATTDDKDKLATVTPINAIREPRAAVETSETEESVKDKEEQTDASAA